MKFFKKLICAAVACSMACALSIPAFAAVDKTPGTYTVEFKVQDEKGNVITSAQAGSKVYVAAYVYQESDPTADFVIAADSGNMLVFEVDIPAGFMANEKDYNGTDRVSYSNVIAGTATGTATITDFVADIDAYAIEYITDIKSGITLSNKTPVLKSEFTLGEAAEDLEILSFSDTFQLTDGLIAANGCNCPVTKFTITEKKADDDTVKAETQTSGSVKVTYPEGYTGNKNLDGKYIVFKNVVLQGTEVTADTRFDIEYNGTKKRFGATLFETLGVVGQGSLNAGTYGFGVAFDSDVNASDVTITKVNETVNE